MRRFWLILPVIVVALGATWAYTSADGPDRTEHGAMEEVFALAGQGYRLGVVLSELSPQQRDDLNIDSGVEIREVLSDSPAEKAGLKEGDILIRIDGKEVESDRDVRRALRNLDDRKEMKLEILRDGKPSEIRVTPEKREFEMFRNFGGIYIGVSLQELDADLAAYFQTEPGAGMLITRVEKNSPAEKAGLKSGDVITEFEGKKIDSQRDLRDALNEVEEEKSAKVTVLRHGKSQTFTVTPEKMQFEMPRIGNMRELKELGELRELRNLPELRELRNLPNNPEFRESMEDLKQEMEKIKRQMEDLKQDLEKLRNSD
jgi:C-terminal processing protease CtpA/Prc